jgi:hypothetical protein
MLQDTAFGLLGRSRGNDGGLGFDLVGHQCESTYAFPLRLGGAGFGNRVSGVVKEGGGGVSACLLFKWLASFHLLFCVLALGSI